MTEFDRLSPREAVTEMLLAGARFRMQHRLDGLGASFIYSLEPGADRERCRLIMAAVKARPGAFFGAFKAEVQRVAQPAGGAPC